jgi:exodeoxyribonuclease VII small subunit
MAKEKMTYDKAYEELEQILGSLESDDIGIDALSSKVKRAYEIINFCKTKLKSTEDEVGKILED